MSIKPVIVDNGSAIIRAGYAGDDDPIVEIPNIIGIPNQTSLIPNVTFPIYLFNDALNKRGILSLKYPMRNGIIHDWDAQEKIWERMFRQVKIEDSVLITDHCFNPHSQKEKLSECFFEKFGVQFFYVQNPDFLSLYAHGRITGLICNIGDGVTCTTPVYEGRGFLMARRRINLGGRDITLYLQKLLMERGHCFTTSAEFEEVRMMKEKLCFVSKDFENDLLSINSNQSKFERDYILPDGNVIKVGKEMFQCCELLFNPAMIGMQVDGIHKMVHQSIQDCDIDTRKSFYETIILTGGTTFIKGFPERLKAELQKLKPTKAKCKIIADKTRAHSAWIGGSILASLSSFNDFWIKREDYDEYGPGIMGGYADYFENV